MLYSFRAEFDVRLGAPAGRAVYMSGEVTRKRLVAGLDLPVRRSFSEKQESEGETSDLWVLRWMFESGKAVLS